MTQHGLSNSQTFSPRGATDPREHLTMSRPTVTPIKEKKEAATVVRPWMLYLFTMFMVMLTLKHSVITSSAWHLPGKWVATATRNSWEGELRTNAATLIPALLRESLLPVELSERRSS